MSASRLPNYLYNLRQVKLKRLEEIVKIEKAQDEYHFLHRADGVAAPID